jgi:chemotaxis protein histidine kinase CheA
MHAHTRRWGLVAAAFLLCGGSALAQSGGNVGSAQAQTAYGEWRKLSQSEVNCVDQALRGQGTRLWTLIQRGIGPANSGIAKFRATCHAQAKTQSIPSAVNRASQALAAADEGKVTVTTTVTKLTPDKPTPDKMAADSAAVKALADKAAADQAAADKLGAETEAKAVAEAKAADKAAADKAVAEKAAAERAAAAKAAAEKAEAEKTRTAKAAMEQAKAENAKAEAEHIKTQAVAVPPSSPEPQNDNVMAAAMFAASAAEVRTSFVYGLIVGPILFGLGGLGFLLMHRRRNAAAAVSDVAKKKEVDGLVAAVIAELKLRDRVPEAATSVHERRIADAAVH